MCALCSVLMTSHWAEVESARRDRVFRVALLNRVLAHFGLELNDWSGRVYLLSNRKGTTRVVDDLGSLWPAAAELAGRPLDPLEPALVAALSRE